MPISPAAETTSAFFQNRIERWYWLTWQCEAVCWGTGAQWDSQKSCWTLKEKEWFQQRWMNGNNPASHRNAFFCSAATLPGVWYPLSAILFSVFYAGITSPWDMANCLTPRDLSIKRNEHETPFLLFITYRLWAVILAVSQQSWVSKPLAPQTSTTSQRAFSSAVSMPS